MIKLIHGNCIDEIKNIPKDSIDLLLTDPPYNIARKTNFKTMKSRGGNVGMDFGDWDVDADILNYIDYLPNVLKENSNVFIFNCWQNLGTIKNKCLENNIFIKRCIVLDKKNPAPFNRDIMFVNNVEFALWGVYSSKKKPSKWTFNRQEKLEKCTIETTAQSSKYHPTMKDLKVITKIVELLSNKGDTVLDLFMGSGTTGIASKILKRNFIGIEIDDNYYKTAVKRINNTQNTLF
jgi:DNA modification methylase